jgi:CBS-domain-containing membrane protein
MDVLKALEPDYARTLGKAHLSRFGIGPEYIDSIMKEHDGWNLPMDELCAAAGRRKVGEIMCTPTAGEYVAADATLQEAVHRFCGGDHHALLVTGGARIVGVLRLADVFASVCHAMKESEAD